MSIGPCIRRSAGVAALLVGALLPASCATVGDGALSGPEGRDTVTTDSSGGAGGGTLTTTGATGVTTTSPSTSTSEAPKRRGPPYPIVLAHGIIGWDSFAGLEFATYFYGVKAHLEALGHVVETPAIDPLNDSTYRGKQLLAHVEALLARTGSAKVNLIAHSQGGLDARVVAALRPDLVASVVTLSTPHRGTLLADIALGLAPTPFGEAAVDELAKLLLGGLYAQVTDETSLTRALGDFTTTGSAAFNARYPDAPGVYYASVAGRSASHATDGDCRADDPQPFTQRFDDTLDLLDIPLLGSALILSGGLDNYASDGITRVRDARWGRFWGCVPADHFDEIGQILGDPPGLGNDWDHRSFYADVAAKLRALGF